MVLVLRRTAIFIVIVLTWALLAAAVGYSTTRDRDADSGKPAIVER